MLRSKLQCPHLFINAARPSLRRSVRAAAVGKVANQVCDVCGEPSTTTTPSVPPRPLSVVGERKEVRVLTRKALSTAFAKAPVRPVELLEVLPQRRRGNVRARLAFLQAAQLPKLSPAATMRKDDGSTRGRNDAEEAGSTTGSTLSDFGVYASLFAASAYGVAYENSFLASKLDNAMLHLPPYAAYMHADSGTHEAAMARMLRACKSVDVVRSNFSELPFGCSYTIFVDHARAKVILAFRGTVSDGDIATDIECRASGLSAAEGGDGTNTPLGLSEDDPLYVPLGFQLSVANERPRIEETLAALAAAHPTYSLLITGHSLGAAQALVFYAMRRVLSTCSTTGNATLSKRTRVAAFAPPPVFSEALCKRVMPSGAREGEKEEDSDSAVVSFVYGCDIIPRLQPLAVRTLAIQRYHNHNRRRPILPSTFADDGAAAAMPRYFVPGRVILSFPSDGSMCEVPRTHPTLHAPLLAAAAVDDHFLFRQARHLHACSVSS